MFDKISSASLAILLFLVLLGGNSNLYVFMAAIGFLAFVTFAINVKRVGWAWSHLLLPTFFILASASVFSVLPSDFLRILFLSITAVLLFMIELQLGRESHFLQNVYLLSVFGIYLGIFALQFYFHLNVILTVIAFFLFTYLFIVQGFAGFALPTKKYFYLITSLIISQLAWGILLWPTYFFVNAVVLFCAYYLLWLFGFSVFLGKLSNKKIYWQLTLVFILLLLTLATASWRPLVT